MDIIYKCSIVVWILAGLLIIYAGIKFWIIITKLSDETKATLKVLEKLEEQLKN